MDDVLLQGEGGREGGKVREGEGRGGIKESSVVQTAVNESTDASELRVFLDQRSLFRRLLRLDETPQGITMTANVYLCFL